MSNGRKMRSFSLATAILLLVTSILAAPFVPSKAQGLQTPNLEGIDHTKGQACNGSVPTTATTTASTATATLNEDSCLAGKGPRLSASLKKGFIYSGHLIRRRGLELSSEQTLTMTAAAAASVQNIEDQPTREVQDLRLRSAAKTGWIESIKAHLLGPRQEMADSTAVGAGNIPDTGTAGVGTSSADASMAGSDGKGPRFSASTTVGWIQGRRRRRPAI